MWFKHLRSLLMATRSLSYRFGNSVELIDVPFRGGQPKGGVELAPDYLRELGLLKRVQNLGLKVYESECVFIEEREDSGHYSPNRVVKNPLLCGMVAKKTADAVHQALKNNRVAVVIGGDHSIGTGTVFGSLEYDDSTCVLWVDAHADLNSPMVTKSGNIHGMPISWLLKGIPEFPVVPGYEWTKPCLSPKKLAYIGLRDVEPQEVELMQKLGVTAFFIEEIDELGIEATLEKALDAINPNRDCPIHISYDIDSMDPDLAPSTGTKVRGGLTFSEGLYICQVISKTGFLQGVDLVEVNPTLGSEEDAKKTAEIALTLLETLLGKPQVIQKEKLIPYNDMIKAWKLES